MACTSRKNKIERLGDLTAQLLCFSVLLLTVSARFEKLTRIDAIVLVEFTTMCKQLFARTLIERHVYSRQSECEGAASAPEE